MKKVAVLGAFAILSLALVVPAQAKVHYAPTPPAKTCTPRSVGYNATGTLVASSLTVDANGRYSGTLEVDRARRSPIDRAPTGARSGFLLSGSSRHWTRDFVGEIARRIAVNH